MLCQKRCQCVALEGEVGLLALVVSPVCVGTGASEGQEMKLEVPTSYALNLGLGQTLATMVGSGKPVPDQLSQEEVE